MIDFLLYKLGVLATRLFPLGVVYAFARFLANCHFLLDRDARIAVIDNLRHVLADQSPREGFPLLARRVFLQFSANVVDFLRLPRLTPEMIDESIEVVGWENVERAHREGRGIIILSAHFGNWEYGAVLLSRRGHQVSAVTLAHGSPRVTQLFADHRQSQGVRSLPVHGSIFDIIRSLRSGGVVCIVSDRELAGQGMPAHFFDAQTMMPRAQASIAVKTGAAIVPAYMVRLGPGRYRAVLEPAVPYDDLPEAERVELLVDRCLRIIEGWIRANPDQWMVFESNWPPRDTGS